MKRGIIVTGAGGQTGLELQRLAGKQGRDHYRFFQRRDLDIADEKAVTALLQEARPAALINCAAYTKVDKAEIEQVEAELVNGTAPGVLAAACAKSGCRFIHISTDYVFDGKGSRPLLPTDTPHPVNAYGQTKLNGELNALVNNPDSIIIRTAWVYSEFGGNFVKTMLRLMGERETLNVVADQLGSPTYAKDLAEMLMTVAEAPVAPGGIYHYTNTGICSWYEFASEIGRLAQLSSTVNPINTEDYPTPAARPKWSVLDTSKIRDTFNITIPDWQSALARCITSIQQNA